jgi:2-polyprenyl-3-methyl-5-hydroxy-6-metoxy-1,4-benzoquinol methylase
MFFPGNTIAYWWNYKTHVARYIFAAKFVKGKEILDAGCGIGYGSSYLLRKGAKKVTGVEINSEVTELAKVHYARAGLEFINRDVSNLPFADNSFDMVTSIGMIDHVDDPDKVLIELQRVLRPDGYFLCSVVNKEFITLPIFKIQLDPFHHL